MGHHRHQTQRLNMNIRKSKWSSNYRRHAGFSLVEVLVSIVVLSFGLLGMVGMQAASLQANKDARLQSSAVFLGRELAETIRGNKNVGILASSNPYVGSFSTSPLVVGTPSYCLNATPATACTGTTDVANAQMTEWLSRVDEELPGARVDVCFDSTPFTAGGLPQWACSNTGGVLVVKIGWTRRSTDRTQSGASGLDKATTPLVVLPVTPGSAT